jgi:hypothetical protein
VTLFVEFLGTLHWTSPRSRIFAECERLFAHFANFLANYHGDLPGHLGWQPFCQLCVAPERVEPSGVDTPSGLVAVVERQKHRSTKAYGRYRQGIQKEGANDVLQTASNLIQAQKSERFPITLSKLIRAKPMFNNNRQNYRRRHRYPGDLRKFAIENAKDAWMPWVSRGVNFPNRENFSNGGGSFFCCKNPRLSSS